MTLLCRDPVVFYPAVEMEEPDPGMVLQHVFQLHAQNDIVAEQLDLRMGIPVVQPLRPGDEEDDLAGTGDPVHDPVALHPF